MTATLIEANELMPVSSLNLLIFGPPGAGKTSLAQTADDPLTLDLDRGVHRSAFRRAAMRFDCWADLAAADAEIAKRKTIVPDTAGRLLDMLAADIIAGNAKHGSKVGGLSLQGFGALKARFANWLGQMRLAAKDIVFIAHEKEERDGDERIMRPDIQGASYTELMKSCDLVGYLSLDGRGKRWLDFNPSDKHLGKNAAGWDRMEVPHLSTAPHFLADLIADAKSKIGKTSEASAAAAKIVSDWEAWLASDPTIEQLNERLPKLGELHNGVKAQVWTIIQAKASEAGLTFDRATKHFRGGFLMLRVSTTQIEDFRRVLCTEYRAEAEVIASIQGRPFEPSWQMMAGRAWHSALEGNTMIHAQRKVMCMRKTTDGNVFWLESQAAERAAEDTEKSGLQIQAFPCEVCGLWHIGKPSGKEWLIREGDYAFADYAVDRGRAIIGPGVWEVKATKGFDIGGEQVEVVAKADHCHGLVIRDNKTKFSQVDAKDYEASLQWRLYLLIHGAEAFRYNLFSFRDPADGFCELTGITSFTFFPYVGLDTDCLLWLTAFVDWARERGLTGFLQREGSSPAAPDATALAKVRGT